MRCLVCFCSLLPAASALAAPPDANATAEVVSVDGNAAAMRILQVLNDILATHRPTQLEVRALRAEIEDIRTRLRLVTYLNNAASTQYRATQDVAREVRDARTPSVSLLFSAAGNDKVIFAGPLLEFAYTGLHGLSLSLEAGGGFTDAAARLGAGLAWRPGAGPIGGGVEIVEIWGDALDYSPSEDVSYTLLGIGPRSRWLIWGEWSPWSVRADGNFLCGRRQTSRNRVSSGDLMTIYWQRKSADLFLGWEASLAIELRF